MFYKSLSVGREPACNDILGDFLPREMGWNPSLRRQTAEPQRYGIASRVGLTRVIAPLYAALTAQRAVPAMGNVK